MSVAKTVSIIFFSAYLITHNIGLNEWLAGMGLHRAGRGRLDERAGLSAEASLTRLRVKQSCVAEAAA
jgi:hypothetical protein